jgi:hypothetical protein
MPIVYPIGPITPIPSSTPSVTITPSVTPSIGTSSTPSPTPSYNWNVSPSLTPSITLTPTPTLSIDCGGLNIFDQMQGAALKFMQTSIGYHKLNLNETKRNIYGESLEKWYYKPFVLRCLIERNDDNLKDEMFGPDVQRSLKVTVPRLAFDNETVSNINGANILPEIGDIFEDRNTERYYEVHNVISKFLPIITNATDEQLINCPQNTLVVYDLECYQTRVTKLNILPNKII